MSLIEKFLEEKKAMYAKFDKAREACDKAVDDATEEFLAYVRSLAVSTPDEEILKFIFEDNDELTEADKLAMLMAMTEAKEKGKKPDKPEGGPGIVIIGLH